jgi:hypothetical protein
VSCRTQEIVGIERVNNESGLKILQKIQSLAEDLCEDLSRHYKNPQQTTTTPYSSVIKQLVNLIETYDCDNDIIFDLKKLSESTQVERYGPYTAVYGYFMDRITVVISGTEIRPYHNEITVRIRLYTMKIQPRIRCRITVPKITRKYGPFTAPYEANLR